MDLLDETDEAFMPWLPPVPPLAQSLISIRTKIDETAFSASPFTWKFTNPPPDPDPVPRLDFFTNFFSPEAAESPIKTHVSG